MRILYLRHTASQLWAADVDTAFAKFTPRILKDLRVFGRLVGPRNVKLVAPPRRAGRREVKFYGIVARYRRRDS